MQMQRGYAVPFPAIIDSRKIHSMQMSHLATKMKELCPILSKVDVKVCGKSNTIDRMMESAYSYVIRMIKEDLEDFEIYWEEETKMTIESRPKSIYRFKKSEISTWESFRDEFCDNEFKDDDFVNDTFYAVVEAEDVPNFIKESGEMINGEERIDPLSDGKFHAVVVYVISDKIFPEGFEEMVRRKKEHRNMNLHLILDEEVTKKFVEKGERLLPLFESEDNYDLRL